MRVLLTTEPSGGVWTFTTELTGELLQRGHAVALVSLGCQPSHDQRAWCAAQNLAYGPSFQFTVSNVPLEWAEKNEFVFTQGAGVLSHVARQFRPDLLHSNQFCFGAISLDIPKLVTVHGDVLSWASACHARGLGQSRWLRQYRLLVTQGLQLCDAVVSPTRWMALELARHYNDLPPSYVIRHGRSLNPPESRLRSVQAVTVGGLSDEAKNIEMLRAVNSPIPIHVADERQGGNPVAPRQVGHAILLGALPQSSLLALFARSSIYIVTSIYEPFGMAPLEAALCGCAVVANDIASLREVWGDDALYFDGPRSLSTLLQQLSRDERRLAEARERSFARASELTAQRMADGYEALYRALLASRPGLRSQVDVRPGLAAHAA
jgi:glycosyltransferase involved in cell wall biosynthesis